MATLTGLFNACTALIVVAVISAIIVLLFAAVLMIIDAVHDMWEDKHNG